MKVEAERDREEIRKLGWEQIVTDLVKTQVLGFTLKDDMLLNRLRNSSTSQAHKTRPFGPLSIRNKGTVEVAWRFHGTTTPHMEEFEMDRWVSKALLKPKVKTVLINILIYYVG